MHPKPSYLALPGANAKKRKQMGRSKLKNGTPRRKVSGTRSSIEITPNSISIRRQASASGTRWVSMMGKRSSASRL
jgi:hypothetical protein